MKNQLRVGLFGIGLETYWPQFKGLKPRLEGYVRTVQKKLALPSELRRRDAVPRGGAGGGRRGCDRGSRFQLREAALPLLDALDARGIVRRSFGIRLGATQKMPKDGHRVRHAPLPCGQLGHRLGGEHGVEHEPVADCPTPERVVNYLPCTRAPVPVVRLRSSSAPW